ncbi:MAG: pentapeptide repeat-containing protein [Acidobacteriota bacterium]
MFKKLKIEKLVGITLSLFAFVSLGCEPPATNSNTNLTVNANLNSNINTNLSNANLSNANMSNETGAMIDTKEPDKYQATVKLKFETSGEQKLATPPIQAEVARDGANRRMEITAPNGEKVIYLETNGKKLLISPQRKQFGELNKEALGFEIQSLMMPDQIINRVGNLKGVQRIGDENYNGREVVKYRYNATTNTQTKAGNVETESFILVDKETGLPLLSETNTQSQGNVQGINGVRLVTELSNIKTTVDESLFAEPTDYKQVEPAQIRQQVNQLFTVAMAVIGQLMKSAQPAATPMMTPNP